MPYVANNLDVKATSQYIQLVTFTWAGGTVTAQYSASDKTYTTFVACPLMSIDFGKQTGGVEDEPVTIKMPVLDPVATMLVGYPFSRCTVLIEEIDITDASTRRKLFYGMISQCTGNKDGVAGMCEAKVAGLRSWLEFPLGIPALNTCVWQFGDKNCAKDLSTIRVNRTISSIVGTTVTFSAGISGGDFNRGTVSVAGLTLLIRSQTSTSVVEMVNIPPPSWVAASAGNLAVVTPGCRKTYADCKKWSNILKFGGFGIAIPAFHPSIETQ